MLLLSLIKLKARLKHLVTNDLMQAIVERNNFKKKVNQTISIIDGTKTIMKITLKKDYFNTLSTDDDKRPKQLWKNFKYLKFTKFSRTSNFRAKPLREQMVARKLNVWLRSISFPKRHGN